MRTAHHTFLQTIPQRIVIAAIAMLAGILSLSYGYYGNNKILLLIGIIITLGGVMTELIFSIIGDMPTNRRKIIHKN